MGFGVLVRLKDLLSPHNARLLAVALGGLVNPDNPAFVTYWKWYRVARGGSLEDVTACSRLIEELVSALQEYVGGGAR